MQRISDVISGFESFYVQPMREPKVKRYTVNPVPNDMNSNRPIARCINDKLNLLDYKIIKDGLGLKLDFMTWFDFDWDSDVIGVETHPRTKQTIYFFIGYRDKKSTVLKCVKL